MIPLMLTACVKFPEYCCVTAITLPFRISAVKIRIPACLIKLSLPDFMLLIQRVFSVVNAASKVLFAFD